MFIFLVIMNSSDDKGFSRKCGSKLHTSDISNFKLIDLKHGKKITRKDSENLLRLEVIKSRTRFICDHCFQSAKSVARDSSLSYEQLYEKITHVGSSLQDDIKADITKLKANPLRNILEALHYHTNPCNGSAIDQNYWYTSCHHCEMWTLIRLIQSN